MNDPTPPGGDLPLRDAVRRIRGLCPSVVRRWVRGIAGADGSKLRLPSRPMGGETYIDPEELVRFMIDHRWAILADIRRSVNRARRQVAAAQDLMVATAERRTERRARAILAGTPPEHYDAEARRIEAATVRLIADGAGSTQRRRVAT